MNVFVKVDFPARMKGRGDLLIALKKKHEEEGSASPLRAHMTPELEKQLEETMMAIEEVEALRKKFRQAIQYRNQLLGKGVSKRTPGKLPFLLAKWRDALLVAYRGLELKLTDWGFNVTMTEVSIGAKRTQDDTLSDEVADVESEVDTSLNDGIDDLPAES